MKEIVAKNGHRFQIAPYTDDIQTRAFRSLNIKRGPDQAAALDVEAMMEVCSLLIVSWRDAEGTDMFAGLTTGPRRRQKIAETPGLSEVVLKWSKEAKDEAQAGFEADSGN